MQQPSIALNTPGARNDNVRDYSIFTLDIANALAFLGSPAEVLSSALLCQEVVGRNC